MNGMARADIVEVDNLYIETERTFNSNRGYLLPSGSEPKYNFNIGLDMVDGLGILYSNSVISSTVDQSQFRYIALDTEFGINFVLPIQLYYRHYSGHMLDYLPDERFPEENVIGLRLNIIGR